MIHKEKLPQAPYQYNGLALAYMGDAVFEIYVRRHLLSKGGTKPHLLHIAATKYVSAKAQAKILYALMDEDYLLEQELEIVKRGRNAKSATVPKNTDVTIYRMGTAFESLIGFLYLDEQTERLDDIVHKGFQIIEGNEGDQ
ncbi:Mini-ribonuclease 3 [Caldalkalibacillus mannanilyticus]|uniref:Mini-ribonuclease 3 n=1 Tax=Caldalkalibacillus mannanilyticus TaxID=1418 RepID=UPI00046AC861|nr:Mini-ribonuclease 3 [Caldalkalibacillus mannanilyticus]